MDRERTGELAALENILFTLYGGKRDGTELLERFGSYSGIFDASEGELVEFGLTERVAKFFAYGKRLIGYALRQETASDVLDSAHAIVRFVSALFYAVPAPHECMLCLDGEGRVERVVELDRTHAVRSVLGNAAMLRARSVVWVRYTPSGRSRVEPKRLHEVTRAADVLAKIGCELVDYVEYSPPLFYSAVFARGRRELTGCDKAIKTPYRAPYIDGKNCGKSEK